MGGDVEDRALYSTVWEEKLDASRATIVLLPKRLTWWPYMTTSGSDR